MRERSAAGALLCFHIGKIPISHFQFQLLKSWLTQLTLLVAATVFKRQNVIAMSMTEVLIRLINFQDI